MSAEKATAKVYDAARLLLGARIARPADRDRLREMLSNAGSCLEREDYIGAALWSDGVVREILY